MNRQIGLSVVVVLMTISEGALKTLFVRHDRARWALPTGIPRPGEPLAGAAERIIAEQVGIQVDYLEQLFTFDSVVESKSTRAVTVSYYGLVPSALLRSDQLAQQDQVNWFSERQQPRLVGDHSEIVKYARRRLQGKMAYTAVGFELLPDTFTLVELQQLYEVILGKVIDKRNFRRKVFELGIVEETGKRSQLRGRGRPPALFRFKPEVFQQLDTKGDIFPF